MDQLLNRLEFFSRSAKEQFSFLNDYDFSLNKEERGQTEKFEDYFSELTYIKGKIAIKIHFSSDIINGMRKAFPKLNDDELPVLDSQITCSIWDPNAFMSVHSYIEKMFPETPVGTYTIELGTLDLNSEITRVLKKYAEFFKAHLTSVLEGNIIYDCYTDRFYDKVFKEIHYR
jgi:hypothetical protein